MQDLSDFKGMDFAMDANGYSKVLAPHVTKVISVPLSGMFFPLKRRYDKVNFSLEEDPGDDGEDEEFQFPDLDSGVDASLRDGEDVAAEPERPAEPRYAIDKRGRRYPIDEYGNRVIPGNRRPPGFRYTFGTS